MIESKYKNNQKTDDFEMQLVTEMIAGAAHNLVLSQEKKFDFNVIFGALVAGTNFTFYTTVVPKSYLESIVGFFYYIPICLIHILTQ